MLVSVKREGGNWTEERDGTTLGHGDSRGAKCRGKALSVAVDGQVIHLYVIHLYAPFVYTSRDAQNAGPLGNVSVTTVWRLIPSLSVQWSTHFFLAGVMICSLRELLLSRWWSHMCTASFTQASGGTRRCSLLELGKSGQLDSTTVLHSCWDCQPDGVSCQLNFAILLRLFLRCFPHVILPPSSGQFGPPLN